MLFYFAGISYSLITKYNVKLILKTSIKEGLRNVGAILPFFVFFGLIILLINYILKFIGYYSFGSMILAGFILIFPSFVFGRVLLIKCVNKVI